jgi:dienelactone hydrolase
MKFNLHFKTLLFSSIVLITVASAQTAKRQILPSDIYRMEKISHPVISPDGNWVAYQISRNDSTKDNQNKNIYMVSWDGKENIQLTHATKKAESYAWSPDDKYLSFLAPDDEGTSQVHLMDRRGGEAFRLTQVKGDIQSYAWSPDGSQLALAITELNNADTAKTKIRKPYVMDRYHFKEDYVGYLDNRKTHLYLFNIKTKQLDTLTRGQYNENSPNWSPDGKQIVFTSNHTADPDQNENSDLFITEPRTGATVRQLTTFKGRDSKPVWSPDGSLIAYLRSATDKDFISYDQDQLAIVPAGGGDPIILSVKNDRPISEINWSSDGKQIWGLMEDDRKKNIVSWQVSDRTFRKITDKDAEFSDLNSNKKGKMTTLFSDGDTPEEVYALDGERPRRLTFAQDSFLAPLKSIYQKGFRSRSKDGTSVSGILYLPDSTSRKMPLILFIHGGPMAQDGYGYDEYRQILSASGFAVAAVNYRGSTGRGGEYERAIYADWGNKEVMDIIGAADQLIADGYADPQRLGIGGWSYGGILSDYTIATDTRFKAAVSGAGSALQLSMFGTDQYINQYMNELGAPWKNLDKWLKLSYPFLQADKIKTATLFMASQNDFNVPAAGAEQMYQALKSTGVPTKLVIYPLQNHGLSVPSYVVDRYQRTIEWFKTYLK